MPKHVGSNVLFAERRARSTGDGYVFGQQVRDTIWAEANPARGREEYFSVMLGRLLMAASDGAIFAGPGWATPRMYGSSERPTIKVGAAL